MSRRALALAAAVWLALLGLTLALSWLAATHDTLPGDIGIATRAQDLPFPGEPLSDGVRAITATETVLASGAAIALLLWLRGYRRPAVALAVGLVILPLAQYAVKEIVDRPRPDPELVELRASFSSPSFPSGHVMSAAYLYGFLLYLAAAIAMPPLGRWALGLTAAAILVLSGPANVYLGVHWPSDVVGGYAWALLLLVPGVVADRFRAGWPAGRFP